MPMTSLVVVFFVSLWGTQPLVLAAQQNVVVDDTDASIVYQPLASWSPSTSPCTGCPDASNAFNLTYHGGVHIIPLVDTDDVSVLPTPSASTPTKQEDKDGDSDDNGNDKDGDKGRKRMLRKLPRRPPSGPDSPSKTDADDPNFKDPSVTVQFNFTGNYSTNP